MVVGLNKPKTKPKPPFEHPQKEEEKQGGGGGGGGETAPPPPMLDRSSRGS